MPNASPSPADDSRLAFAAHSLEGALADHLAGYADVLLREGRIAEASQAAAEARRIQIRLLGAVIDAARTYVELRSAPEPGIAAHTRDGTGRAR